MAVPSEPLLIPFMEACRILNVGKTCLYGLIARGEVQSIKLGKRRLIPTEEIWRLANGEPSTRLRGGNDA